MISSLLAKAKFTKNHQNWPLYDVASFEMHLLPVLALLIAASLSYGQTISVNFHVGNDADNQQDHELASGESAGFVAADNWNNIDVGDGGGNSAGAIFAMHTTGSGSPVRFESLELTPNRYMKWANSAKRLFFGNSLLKKTCQCIII